MEIHADTRREDAARWAAERLGTSGIRLETVSGDASFRRYFRIQLPGRSLILMDAPPEKEDSRRFIDIAGRLRRANLRAPEIAHFDLQAGFGLLEDFGDTLYREVISADNGRQVMPSLFGLLERLARDVDTEGLPEYNATRLQRELNLFPDWYLAKEKHQQFSGDQLACWQDLCHKLIQSAEQQTQVFVHRDFHSSNLLQTGKSPGVIDFQDGVIGPISYDLASLLWDRYISWPRDLLEEWMLDCHQRLQPGCGEAEWIRACDWMGLQRNLKIVGIFARLFHRDGKPLYLEMIPRFYAYIEDVLPLYPELRDFEQLLKDSRCAP